MVADVFHVIRLALVTLDEVRRRGQRRSTGHRGYKTRPVVPPPPGARVGQERLDESKRHNIYQRLRAADTEDEVAAAWYAVDLLRRMCAAPDRDTAHRRLVAFQRVSRDGRNR